MVNLFSFISISCFFSFHYAFICFSCDFLVPWTSVKLHSNSSCTQVPSLNFAVLISTPSFQFCISPSLRFFFLISAPAFYFITLIYSIPKNFQTFTNRSDFLKENLQDSAVLGKPLRLFSFVLYFLFLLLFL